MTFKALTGTPRRPDWLALMDNLLRKGTPRRVHHMELFHDPQVRDAIAERFDLMKGVSQDDPHYECRKLIAVNRFVGWDYVVAGLDNVGMTFNHVATDDTAALSKGVRTFMNEHRGPVTTWEEFEKYPWPRPDAPDATAKLEWFQKNLPEDMCIIGGLTAHFAEEISWLPGYETLCFLLYDNRPLVEAIRDKLIAHYRTCVRRILQFDRVKAVWASDDMGYKTGLLISPADTRQFVLPGHRLCAKMAHDAGRPYLLHACGNLRDIIDDLADDVRIDAKHSFEDTIENVCDAKSTYGRRMALIGGMDVDFMCRADEPAIRARVRRTLDRCMPGGGYCLGTGNSVANYMPLDNYLAMVDEGLAYC